MTTAKKMVEGFKVGEKIKYKAGGKVSRLEGVNGKVVKGVIKAFRQDPDSKEWNVTVLADHRTKKDAHFYGLCSSLRLSDIQKI